MNDKSTKSQTHTSGSPEASVLNAALDSIIIELLKRYPQGLCPNEIREKVKEYPELGGKDYRTRIGTRLEYLAAFGRRSGLFEIRSKLEDKPSQEGKKEVFQYFNKMSDAEIQLMLRSYRTIKGKPAEKLSKDKNTGKKTLIRRSRDFFADLTTKKFIRSFDNEEPPEMHNPEMINNIKTIQSAISDSKVLAIRYGDYDINRQLCPRKNKAGKDMVYTVYPIKMVVSLGRYYLYCRHKYYGNLSCMRVDRIITCAKTSEDCPWHDEDKDVLLSGIGEPHFAQRLYMFTGKAYKITFLTDEKHLNDVTDDLFKRLTVLLIHAEQKSRKHDDHHADRGPAVLCWAMQYSRFVRVTDPPELVETIKKTLEEASLKYQ